MKGLEITGYRPGAIGRIIQLHAEYYYKKSGFGLYFETKVAEEMVEFLNRFNFNHDGFWIVINKEKIIGSIAIDGSKDKIEGNHLRWFIVEPKYHGRGIGRQLLNSAINFCKRKNASKVFLWTFAGLDVARHLYETSGFQLIKEEQGDTWGISVKEQLFELNL